jgi:hypothetical protein
MNKFFLKIDDWVIESIESVKRIFSQEKNKNVEVITPIIEKLIDEQQVYADVLIRLINSIKHREVEIIPEAKTELESREIPVFFRSTRMDVLYKEESKFLQAEAKITNPPEFSPIIENWKGIEVVLSPFVWHQMEFTITGPAPNMTQMQNWFNRWFDRNNKNPEDSDGLRSVIHMMTEPKVLGNYWVVTIDFGSATIDAFHAFFKQLKFSGAEKVEISSAKYIRDLTLGMQSQSPLDSQNFIQNQNMR